MENNSPYVFENMRREYRIIDEPDGTRLIKGYGRWKSVLIEMFPNDGGGFLYDALNAKSEKDIIQFCSKYGSLGIQNRYTTDTATLDEYKKAFTCLQSLVQLRTEIDNGRLEEALKLLIFFDRRSEVCGIDGQVLTEQFREWLATVFPFGDDDRENDDIYAGLTSSGIDSSFDLLTGQIAFGFDFDKLLANIGKGGKAVLDFANRRFLCEMNHFIGDIKQQLTLSDDGAIQPTVAFPALYNLLFYCFFLKLVDRKVVRRCKNRTCNNFFEIIGNDMRKIYCCTDCAKLEQKRMERERKKKAGVTIAKT